jgi:hypothetical protein
VPVVVVRGVRMGVRRVPIVVVRVVAPVAPRARASAKTGHVDFERVEEMNASLLKL